MSFFANFTDPDDEEELINNLIRYISGNCFNTQVASDEGKASNTLGSDSLDDVSSYFLRNL